MLPQIGDVTTFLQTLQGLTDAFMIMFSTPDKFTFGLIGIKGLWLGFAFVANALMVIFLIVGVMQIMISRSGGKNSRMTLQELITKLVIQAFGINASFFLVQTLVNIENALCSGILAFTVTTTGNQVQQNGSNIVSMLLGMVLGDLNSTNTSALILAIIGIVFIIVLFVVFFQAITRLLRLNLFLVLSPLAFPFLMLEQTREYGSFILKTLVITIFVQFLQVVAFCLTLFLLVSAFAGGAFGSPIIKLIMVIGQLIAVAGIPRLLVRLGLPSGGGDFNTAFSAARSVAKKATRGFLKSSRGGRSSGQRSYANARKQNAQSNSQNSNTGKSVGTERKAIAPARRGMRSSFQGSNSDQRLANAENEQGVSRASRSRKPTPRTAVRPMPSRIQVANGESSQEAGGQRTTRRFNSGSDRGTSSSSTGRQTTARTRWMSSGGSASRRSRERRSRLRRIR